MRAKYIYEKFVEDTDPIRDMGIGIIHQFKEWSNYINSTKSTGMVPSRNFIDPNFKFNDDSTIDIGKPISSDELQEIINMRNKGNYKYNIPEPIIIRGDDIKKIPNFINFNICYGSCFINVSSIKSLRGCPKIIYGSFCINSNHNLKKLDFLPEIVYQNIYVDSHFKIIDISKRCKVYGKICYV